MKSSSFFKNIWQMIFFSIKNFIKNKDTYKAGSLTYYSLMAIIPLLAICFGIAQALGLQEFLEQELYNRFVEQKEIISELIPLASNVLEETKGGWLAIFGFVFLCWSVIKVLSHLDHGFNHIWKVFQYNNWQRRIGKYFVLILVVPIFLFVTGIFNIVIISQIKLIYSEHYFLQSLSTLVSYFLIWCLFIFIYLYLPIEKVHLGAAILGGIIAGTLFQFLQGSYLFFQIALARLGALYGSFAALPLLLIWLQLSWIIVLFGAEMCFAFQNLKFCKFEQKGEQFCHRDKVLIFLWITHHCIQSAIHAKNATSLTYFSKSLQIPKFIIKKLLEELVDCGILIEIRRKKSKDISYQIHKDISFLRLCDVIDIFEKKGGRRLPTIKLQKWQTMQDHLEQFSKLVSSSKGNVLLKDL